MAVKILTLGVPGRTGDRAWFFRILQMLDGVSHSAVIRPYKGGSDGRTAWFRTVFMPEGDLGHRIRNRGTTGAPFTLGEVVYLLRPVADALDHLHSRGIVHGDVKPANILLSEGREHWTPSVLADFSSSVVVGRSHSVIPVIPGTESYMAPECLRGGRDCQPGPGISGDIYALGLVMWEMLTLRRAYDMMPADTWRHGRREIVMDPGWTDVSLRPWVRELNLLFRVLLADNLLTRPRTASAVIDQAQHLLRLMGEHPVPRVRAVSARREVDQY